MMAGNDPESLNPPPSNEETNLEAAREIAKMISEFRQEVMDKFHQDIDDDMKKMEAEGFDPARGRGRGPFWADGG